MYGVTPQKQNKLDVIACGACFACGVGVFAISIINTSLPYVTLAAQLLGVLLLTAGIYLYSKCIARTYTYTVQPGGIFDADGYEYYDLVVTETIGKRKQRTVCRISLRDIVRTEARLGRPSKQNGLPQIVPASGGRIFHYCADLVPKKVLVIYDTDGNAVVLTYDQKLEQILSRE